MRYTKIPSLSGNELNKLLVQKDNWIKHGYRRHGISKKKKVGNKTFITIIPKTDDSLPPGVLFAILGPKQTGIGKKGLLKILNKP